MESICAYVKSRLAHGIGHDLFWTLLGQSVVMVVLLLLNKALSNDLSIEDFGKYNIIRRSTSVISFVLIGGLGISVPRYLSIAISKNKYREVQAYLTASLLYLFVVFILTTVLYLLLYGSLTNIVLGANNFRFYVVCLLYAMTGAMNTYIYSYYRGIGKFRQFNLSQIIVQLLLLVPLLFKIQDLYLIICSWTFLNAIYIISIFVKEHKDYYQLRCRFKVGIKTVKEKFRELFIYSFPRLIGDFFLFAYSAFPVIYIGNHLDLEQASYYSVGVSLVTIVTPLFSFLGIVLLPSISRMIANGQFAVANNIVTRVAFVYAGIAIALTVGLFFEMDLLIHIFFADKYLVASKIGRIIAISLLPQSMYYLYRNPNDAASVFPFNTIILAVCFCLLVVGFLFFDSIVQYAYIYLLVSIVQCLLSLLVWYYYSRKKYAI